jgi:hypothetical protein
VKKRCLPLIAFAVVTALLAGTARAAKPVPVIAISDVRVDTTARGAATACLFDISYTVDGLRGSPAKTWTVWVADGSATAEVAVVAKTSAGVVLVATPAVANAPSFTYPFDGGSHAYTLLLRDAAGALVAQSAAACGTCPANGPTGF